MKKHSKFFKMLTVLLCMVISAIGIRTDVFAATETWTTSYTCGKALCFKNTVATGPVETSQNVPSFTETSETLTLPYFALFVIFALSAVRTVPLTISMGNDAGTVTLTTLYSFETVRITGTEAFAYEPAKAFTAVNEETRARARIIAVIFLNFIYYPAFLKDKAATVLWSPL